MFFLMRILLILVFLIFGSIVTVIAKDQDSTKTVEKGNKIKVEYGSRGWQFSTEDGNFLMQIQSRLQVRYSKPYDTDPITFEDFATGSHNSFKINRARLKVGGNAYRSWLKYYWEYDLASSNLLDFRLMLSKLPYFKVKVGQWKAQYSRERIISSGKQQMVDRSLINRSFTIDRQQGISFYGNLKGKGLADFNYWTSFFSGTGRGARTNDNDNIMIMFRGQWNFLGRQLKFQGSDTKFHKNPAGIIAFAAVTNQSPYTRFSTAGGGQLPGFEDGEPGQYRINQWLEETAYMYRGFSWQQEFHWKKIKDYKNETETILIGNYFQLGYFFHYMVPKFPKDLEIAFRHAFYIPNINIDNNRQQEFSLAGNWFFNDHANKLTMEVAYFNFQDATLAIYDSFRFRLQWDISI
jgi:phosphate-selective porin